MSHQTLNVFAACAMVILLTNYGCSKKIGPRNLPTQGHIWPKAWKEQKTKYTFNLDPANFEKNVTGIDCPKIQLAIHRFNKVIAGLKKITNHYVKYNSFSTQNNNETLNEIRIHLSQDCEDIPHIDMDESYSLHVSSMSILRSSSVWGIIRGMETFTQLFHLSSKMDIQIQGTDIEDRPNYSHRALMLDTGRHYISIKNILKTLDAMAINKMNVFHWHIVDDESFPYQSTKLPELSKAAFHSSLVYTKKDMEKVREYAKNLGIRVLMEIDVPGHSQYWSVSHPEVLTKCKDDGVYAPPLNPVKNETYKLVEELLHEVQELFPDSLFHLGGDDVKTTYYLEDPDVQKFMKEHTITDKDEMYKMFFKKVFPLLKNGSAPVVWEEVFNANVTLPDNTLVQIKNNGDGTDSMVKVLKAGKRGIQSAPYNLGITGPNRGYGIDWYYKKDPRLAVQDKINDDDLLKNLVGGTVCVWGEMIDDNNVINNVWPRAIGLAEVLWSKTTGEDPDKGTLRRIEEHVCRMTRRGIPAGPALGPSSCLLRPKTGQAEKPIEPKNLSSSRVNFNSIYVGLCISFLCLILMKLIYIRYKFNLNYKINQKKIYQKLTE